MLEFVRSFLFIDVMNDSAILFPSTKYAMKADREMSNAGLTHSIAPVPKNLSPDCGYCIKISHADKKKALDLLDYFQIPYNGIYDI